MIVQLHRLKSICGTTLYHSLHGMTLAGGAGVQRVRGAQRGRRGHQAHDGGDDDDEDYNDDNDGNYGANDHAGPPQQRHEHLQLPQQGRLGPLHHGGQVRFPASIALIDKFYILLRQSHQDYCMYVFSV